MAHVGIWNLLLTNSPTKIGRVGSSGALGGRSASGWAGGMASGDCICARLVPTGTRPCCGVCKGCVLLWSEPLADRPPQLLRAAPHGRESRQTCQLPEHYTSTRDPFQSSARSTMSFREGVVLTIHSPRRNPEIYRVAYCLRRSANVTGSKLKFLPLEFVVRMPRPVRSRDRSHERPLLSDRGIHRMLRCIPRERLAPRLSL